MKPPSSSLPIDFHPSVPKRRTSRRSFGSLARSGAAARSARVKVPRAMVVPTSFLRATRGSAECVSEKGDGGAREGVAVRKSNQCISFSASRGKRRNPAFVDSRRSCSSVRPGSKGCTVKPKQASSVQPRASSERETLRETKVGKGERADGLERAEGAVACHRVRLGLVLGVGDPFDLERRHCRGGEGKRAGGGSPVV